MLINGLDFKQRVYVVNPKTLSVDAGTVKGFNFKQVYEDGREVIIERVRVYVDLMYTVINPPREFVFDNTNDAGLCAGKLREEWMRQSKLFREKMKNRQV